MNQDPQNPLEGDAIPMTPEQEFSDFVNNGVAFDREPTPEEDAAANAEIASDTGDE